MYTSLILLGIILFPIPSLVLCIRRGLNPYNGVLNATVSVGLSSVLIFICNHSRKQCGSRAGSIL